MSVRWFFPVFFLSGACALVYQVVWLRLAMARYGVTAPMVAIVLSVFMAGIAAGSLGAGRLARRSAGARLALPLALYGLAELVIALSGRAVPALLGSGAALGARLGASEAWASLAHYALAGAWIALLLLPATAAMGATVPLALWAIRRGAARAVSERAFSYLYLANTLGALAGTLLSAFVLFEWLGFAGASQLAVAANALLAALALALSVAAGRRERSGGIELAPGATNGASPEEVADLTAGRARGPFFAALALTGFASLAMEVVWTRLFTSFLGTEVYTFALILAVYLAATAAGAALYRARTARGALAAPPSAALWGALAVAALLPLVAADPRLGAVAAPSMDSVADVGWGALRVALGILPFCLLLGYVTPRLVDSGSRGDPQRAGRAYAVNLAGCIVGPLAAGFLLLPQVGERTAIALLALPLAGLALAGQARRASLRALTGAGLAGATLWLATVDPATRYGAHRLKRDYAATTVALGEGMERRLLVNGVGMTRLTPVTKMMAHLPLALLDHPPESALVVCFGMGTTFRSLASWGIDTTAVELIPGVVELFDFFHADAERVLASPAGARVVVDDGRRFLERSERAFDVITVDPPPPVMAAGSSLLYSKEFYAVAAERLRPGGILHQWLPGGDDVVIASFTRALAESFPHLRVFGSLERWGVHFLASERPIALPSRDELLRRVPERARADLLEWSPKATVASLFGHVFARELAVDSLLARSPATPALTDDRPFNEYFLLRGLASGAPAE